jgi:hypothetical protein
MDVDAFAPSSYQVALTKGLMNIREKLGKPLDCSTNSGWVLLDSVVQVWEKLWPQEKKDWVKQIQEELSVERSVREAIKQDGGYFPMSYPTRLYEMIRAILPEQKLNDKKFIKEMISRYPFLKSTNYKV